MTPKSRKPQNLSALRLRPEFHALFQTQPHPLARVQVEARQVLPRRLSGILIDSCRPSLTQVLGYRDTGSEIPFGYPARWLRFLACTRLRLHLPADPLGHLSAALVP